MKKILLVSLLSLVAAEANSTIIYDNGGPNTDNGYSLGPSGTADDFTIAAGGTVNSIGFYFQNYNGITGWDQAISYNIYTNNSGNLGTLLANGSGANVTATDSGSPWCCGGGNAWKVNFDLQSSFVATAGTTYWLYLNNAGGPSPWWVTTSGIQGYVGKPGNTDFAFYLSGSNTPSVPEPSVIALISIGILGFAVSRKKKNQA